MKILFVLLILLLPLSKPASAFGWYVQEVSAPSLFSYFAFSGNTSECYDTVAQALTSMSNMGGGWTVQSIDSLGNWKAFFTGYLQPQYLISGTYGACNVPLSGGSYPVFIGASYDPTNSATSAPPVMVNSPSIQSGTSTITVASGETLSQAETMLNNQQSQINNESAMATQLSSVANGVTYLSAVIGNGVSSSFDYGLAGELWALPFCLIVALYVFSSNIGKILKLISF